MVKITTKIYNLAIYSCIGLIVDQLEIQIALEYCCSRIVSYVLVASLLVYQSALRLDVIAQHNNYTGYLVLHSNMLWYYTLKLADLYQPYDIITSQRSQQVAR